MFLSKEAYNYNNYIYFKLYLKRKIFMYGIYVSSKRVILVNIYNSLDNHKEDKVFTRVLVAEK